MSDCCCNPLGSASVPAGPVSPLRGRLFVDPLFVGTSTGSSQNPFTTIAAAFAAFAAASLTRGIIILAPGANCVENVTFPATGEWEITCELASGVNAATITGNVTISSTASARRSLTNLAVVGNVSGNCSAGTQRVNLLSASVSGTTTFTSTGGLTRLCTRGGTSEPTSGANNLYTFLTGAVSLAGTFWGSYCVFSTSLTLTTTVAGSSLSFCDLPPTISATAAVTLSLNNCSNTTGGPVAFTASGAGAILLRPDFATLSEMQRFGLTLTGPVTLKGLIGASSLTTQGGAVGVTQLAGIVPAGLQVIDACLTLLANGGTATGNAVLKVVYTDATGTLVTEPVTAALNVAGALGSKGRGSLPFSQNGATAVSFSVDGITNATGLSYKCDVAVRQAS